MKGYEKVADIVEKKPELGILEFWLPQTLNEYLEEIIERDKTIIIFVQDFVKLRTNACLFKHENKKLPANERFLFNNCPIRAFSLDCGHLRSVMRKFLIAIRILQLREKVNDQQVNSWILELQEAINDLQQEDEKARYRYLGVKEEDLNSILELGGESIVPHGGSGDLICQGQKEKSHSIVKIHAEIVSLLMSN